MLRTFALLCCRSSPHSNFFDVVSLTITAALHLRSFLPSSLLVFVGAGKCTLVTHACIMHLVSQFHSQLNSFTLVTFLLVICAHGVQCEYSNRPTGVRNNNNKQTFRNAQLTEDCHKGARNWTETVGTERFSGFSEYYPSCKYYPSCSYLVVVL